MLCKPFCELFVHSLEDMAVSRKDVIKAALSLIFRKDIDLSILRTYFSDDYEQYVDDEFINYRDFVKHVEKVRELAEDLKIDFLQLIEEGSVVFSRHKATTMIHGKLTTLIVFAEFHVNEYDKISKCIETTCLLSGNKEHENLGSTK